MFSLTFLHFIMQIMTEVFMPFTPYQFSYPIPVLDSNISKIRKTVRYAVVIFLIEKWQHWMNTAWTPIHCHFILTDVLSLNGIWICFSIILLYAESGKNKNTSLIFFLHMRVALIPMQVYCWTACWTIFQQL